MELNACNVVSGPVEYNLFFCEVKWNLYRLKSSLDILREQRNFQVDIISSRYKPGLGMTIMVFTAGSQRDQIQPGELIRSTLLCFANPAVSGERGKSDSLE